MSGSVRVHRYPRRVEALERIVADTASCFADHGIDPVLRHDVDFVIEELFVNLVKYNAGAQDEIELVLRPLDGGIEVRLTDTGVERFDPSAPVEVDVDAPLEQRRPGGLGVYLSQRLVDTMRYDYADRRSTITFSKRVK